MGPTKYFLDWQKLLIVQVLFYSNKLSLHMEEKIRQQQELTKEDFASLRNIAFYVKKDPVLRQYLVSWTEARIASYISSMHRAGAFQDRALGTKGLIPQGLAKAYVPQVVTPMPTKQKLSDMQEKFNKMQEKVSFLIASSSSSMRAA